MNLEEDLSESKPEELGEELVDGTSETMVPLGEIEPEVNGEMGSGRPSGFHPLNEAEREFGDEIGEGRGSVSSVEALIFSPVMSADGDLIGGEISPESPLNPVGSPPSSMGDQGSASGPMATKGFGLKKWRRIRRNLNKDVTPEPDSAQILKRRLSLAEPMKGRDEKLRSDGEGEAEESAASVESRVIVGPSVDISPSLPVALDPELRSLAESGFSVGAESENSEERSSKSSTATSAPRLRHEIGFGRERSRIRNISSRGSGHLGHHKGQRAKGGIDANKKNSGDRVRSEKENSYSSVESDLRSSSAAFMGWGTAVSNGKKSEKSVGNEGKNSDDAQQDEEVRSGYCKENGTLEDLSRENLRAESLDGENDNKSEDNRSESYLDPFLESIVSLKAAQAALEDEIQKFGEIGKDAILDDSDGDYEGTNSPALDAQLIELNQKKEHLECELEEALATIKAKEAEVLKLEGIIKRTESPNNLSVLERKCKELEIEVENLLEKKIEAEIEYLVMTRTTQSCKFLVEDHVALHEEQKILAGDQTTMLVKLRNAEEKAIKLKLQADEVNSYCNELVKTQEVLKLQNKVCRYSLCCFIQMSILCITFGLFLMHILPSSSDVVPT